MIKRTNGTTGMKRRFDKDKNFRLFTICSKMVTGLCQNIFMNFTSDCTNQITFVNYLHRLKIPEKSKWYRRHSSVRYVLLCRSTCNFEVNQSNKLFYNNRLLKKRVDEFSIVIYVSWFLSLDEVYSNKFLR